MGSFPSFVFPFILVEEESTDDLRATSARGRTYCRPIFRRLLYCAGARQAGSHKYEFSPINPQPSFSCVGEAATVEPALVGSIGKKRRIRGHLAADAGVDFAP